jgi:hypothetical protein
MEKELQTLKITKADGTVIELDATTKIEVSAKKGHYEITFSGDIDYPGIYVTFYADNKPKDAEEQDPCVIVEQLPENSKPRVVVYLEEETDEPSIIKNLTDKEY